MIHKLKSDRRAETCLLLVLLALVSPLSSLALEPASEPARRSGQMEPIILQSAAPLHRSVHASSPLKAASTASGFRAAKAQRPLAIQPPAQPRDIITEDELQSEVAQQPRLHQHLQRRARNLTQPRPEPDTSAYSRSLVLFDGQFHTIVPYGSILHLPQGLETYIVPRPVSPFLLWPDFLKRNRQWLTTREVPLAMALGDEKADRSVLKDVSRLEFLVVSVYRGNPISVLEKAPPVTASAR